MSITLARVVTCWLASAVTLASLASPAAAHVQLNAPNGGEVFTVGEEITLQWEILIAHNTHDWDLMYSVTGAAPWTEFEQDIPAVGDLSVGAVHSAVVTVLPGMVGTTTRFRVRMDNLTGTDYYDKSDGDITVLPGPWDDLGFALAGTEGEATLVGTGPLSAGSNNRIDLGGALPGVTAFWFLGLAAGNAPFKGGTLVPVPVLLSLPVPTDGAGDSSLPFVWPAGVPAGASFFVHAWFADPAGPKGAAASHALQGIAQ